MSPKKINTLYFHCSLMGNKYKQIILEQIQTIFKSKILSSYYLIIIVSGNDKSFIKELKNKLKRCYHKIIYVGDRLHEYEFPTLIQLQSDCQMIKEDINICYIHSKGVSDPTPMRNQWRRDMMKDIILRWKECEVFLKIVDIVGWSWVEDLMKVKNTLNDNIINKKTVIGYSGGNFWWTTSKFIKTLPNLNDITLINKECRVEAEMWIGKTKLSKIKIMDIKNNKIIFGERKFGN
jgi:hypothetical protein